MIAKANELPPMIAPKRCPMCDRPTQPKDFYWHWCDGKRMPYPQCNLCQEIDVIRATRNQGRDPDNKEY